MKLRHLIYPLAAAILTGLAVTSCVHDAESEPSVPVTPPNSSDELTATITLDITAAPIGGTSRGEYFDDSEITESAASANELIQEWLVAFVKDGTVCAVVEGKPGSGGTSAAAGVWNDRVSLDLPKGKYSAVAFANMIDDNLREAWTEGTTLASAWKDTRYTTSTTAITSTSKVPMSGYLKEFEVKGTVNETFAIEVVRMLAKVEYAVKNLSASQVRVNSFAITPVYDGDIYLFPEYDKKPKPNEKPAYEPRFPAMTDGLSHYGTRTETARAGFVLEAGSPNIERGNFYIKESIAKGNHPTDHFHIGLNITRGGVGEEVTYALADDELKYFYRNDYVLFPIVISDYTPELEVFDYPPIGGYPVNVESNGTEFYATFSSSGAFDILARLRDSQGRTKYLPVYDETNPQAEYVRYVESEPANFPLTYNAAENVWQADFNQGTNQRIVLKFEFKIGRLVYTRTLSLLSNKR
ncbi:MAG: hypothetical protein HDS78_07815 [Bacteroidales bacterium]|nr:hypothetical protein [Bacteroidales bacterium]